MVLLEQVMGRCHHGITRIVKQYITTLYLNHEHSKIQRRCKIGVTSA